MLRVLCLLLLVHTIRCFIIQDENRFIETTTLDPDELDHNISLPFDEDLHREIIESMFEEVSIDLTTKGERSYRSSEQVLRGSIWFDDTIDYKGNVRFTKVYNKNPYPLKVYELTYAETLDGEILHNRSWYHLPEIRPYHDSGKLIYTVKNMSNGEIQQRFTIAVGYRNETYLTVSEAVCRFVPKDQVYPLLITVDIYRKKKLLAVPAISAIGKAHLHNFKGLLEYSTPKGLKKELAILKKEVKELYPDDEFK